MKLVELIAALEALRQQVGDDAIVLYHSPEDDGDTLYIVKFVEPGRRELTNEQAAILTTVKP